MTLAERIIQHVKALPESILGEVLEFVECLEARVRTDKSSRDDAEWSALSLSQAMRGLESEPSPYSADDLKEVFS
jgi:hypothetical protein